MRIEQLTYTDRPRGAGVNTGAGGFQIAACSAEVSKEARERLASLCTHYGDAVYGRAPLSARDAETEWRDKTETLEAVPEAVLAKFPVIWSYERLPGDSFALVRTCYAGRSYDGGRTGNFFSHALIVNAKELASAGLTPLSLMQSHPFMSRDTDSGTSLPVIEKLDGLEPKTVDGSVLDRLGARDQLGSLLSAVINAPGESRPVIVALTHFADAKPMVEVLLRLLPASAACRQTFCTYETDRKWRPPAQPWESGSIPAHALLCVCSEEKKWDFRATEYQKEFAIFNFSAGEFSELPPARRYAAFAAKCFLSGEHARLSRIQQLIDKLACASRADWDALIGAEPLYSASASAADLESSSRALASVAKTPSQAEAALAELWLGCGQWFESDDPASLERLAGVAAPAGELIGRAAGDQDTSAGEFASRLEQCAREALNAGHGKRLKLVLQSLGPLRDPVWRKLLESQGGNFPASLLGTGADPENLQEIIGLIVKTLTGEIQIEPQGGTPNFLVSVFEFALKLGREKEVWRSLKPQLDRIVDGAWSPEKEKFVRLLAKLFDKSELPEAALWSNEVLLEKAELNAKELCWVLEGLARAVKRRPQLKADPKAWVRAAREKIKDEETLLLAFARMSHAAEGADAEKIFSGECRGLLAALKPDHANQIRKKLAEVSPAVVGREIFDQALSEPEDAPAFNGGSETLLRDHPEIAARMCSWLSAEFDRPRGPSPRALSLARALIEQVDGAGRNGPESVELFARVVERLPIEPLSAAWRRALQRQPEGLAPEIKARLGALTFLDRIDRHSGAADWSIDDFPEKDFGWSNGVAALPDGERRRAVQFCLARCAGEGIVTPDHALALLRILHAAGIRKDGELLSALETLMEKRDSITQVQFVMAFARAALRSSEQAARISEGLIAGLLDQLTPSDRELFDEHLNKSFFAENYRDRTRIERFRKSLKQSPEKSLSAEEAAGPVAAYDSGEEKPDGIFGKFRRIFRN